MTLTIFIICYFSKPHETKIVLLHVSGDITEK